MLYRGDHQYRDTSHFCTMCPFHLIFVAKEISRREYDPNDIWRLFKHTCKKWYKKNKKQSPKNMQIYVKIVQIR